MKKIVFFIILAVIIIPSVVLARTYQENITVRDNEVVDRNFIRAGRNIDIAGQVEGDVIVAGVDICISGKVGGDVIAVGNTIKISGEVTGNVRVVGGDVIIDAKIGSGTSKLSSVTIICEKAIAADALVGISFGAKAGVSQYRGDVLPAEEENQVVEQRGLDRAHLVPGERRAQVDAGDLGADAGCQRPHLDASAHGNVSRP